MTTVGIDLGGTKVFGAMVDGGDVLATGKTSTPHSGGPDDVLDAVARVVAKVDPDGIGERIGIGVPGPVLPGSGILPLAGNLPGWDHPVDVAKELSARCGGRMVAVGNDVNVATLAEHRYGAGAGSDNMLAVFMGTGVGAGLVLDGVLRTGPRGVAGELGHAYVAFRDFEAASVGRGEVEDYAGRRMMEARARARHADGEATALVDLVGDGRMKSSTWSKALKQDDLVARSIIDEATTALATALASAIALVDIDLIVLGGGMAERLGEPFRVELESRLHERAFAGVAASIRSASLGDAGGAIGAALLAEQTP